MRLDLRKQCRERWKGGRGSRRTAERARICTYLELANWESLPVEEKTMSATSASHSTESSSAFLKRPRRRLENVTCRAAALSILFISRRSLAIPAVRADDPSFFLSPCTTPQTPHKWRPRKAKGGKNSERRTNRRCDGMRKERRGEERGGGREGAGWGLETRTCSYWQVGINKRTQPQPTAITNTPRAIKQSIKLGDGKRAELRGRAAQSLFMRPPHGTARRAHRTEGEREGVARGEAWEWGRAEDS